jgi:hypothetical protein
MPMKSLGNKLKLRKWLRSGRCDIENLFGAIDDVFEIARRRIKGNADIAGLVLEALAAILEDEGALFTYADSLRHPIDNYEDWTRVLHAAGWIVMDMYDHALEGESWPV